MSAGGSVIVANARDVRRILDHADRGAAEPAALMGVSGAAVADEVDVRGHGVPRLRATAFAAAPRPRR